MIGEPEVRLGAGDAAVWITGFIMLGIAIGVYAARWLK